MTNILIADDDPALATVLEIGLGRDGYTTYTTGNGLEITNFIQRYDIDVVILDVFMPFKEGLESLQEVKAMFPEVIIIAISIDAEFMQMMKELGADYIMEKPIELNDMRALLAGVVKGDS